MACDGQARGPVAATDNPGSFPATHWSILLAARDIHDPATRAAWDHLCRSYWRPVYAYVRRQGCQPADAQDYTQAFFTDFLERNHLTRLRHCEGRFRSFLLTFLTRFLSDERAKSAALKRGGGKTIVGVDEFTAEDQGAVSGVLNAERAFDRRWAMTLLERARTRLRADYVAAGKGPIYDVLQPFLNGEEAVPAYASAAARLGMPENTVKSAVHRLRHHYGRLVREEIASTVETPAQIDEEIHYLLSVVGEEGQ